MTHTIVGVTAASCDLDTKPSTGSNPLLHVSHVFQFRHWAFAGVAKAIADRVRRNDIFSAIAAAVASRDKVLRCAGQPVRPLC